MALLLDCKQKDTSSFWGFVVFRRVTLAAQLRCLRTEGTALGRTLHRRCACFLAAKPRLRSPPRRSGCGVTVRTGLALG